MTSPIWASAMLRTAEKLAGMQAGAGRPAHCDLRRATSTSYYAVFHQLTRHGVLAALPTADEDEVSTVSRWFTHTGVRKAAELVVVASGPDPVRRADLPSVRLLRNPTEASIADPLLSVAEALVELQDARHEADYSNDYDPVRYTTVDHVNTAHEAVRTTWSMWRAGSSPKPARLQLNDSYNRFLLLALLTSGGPRSR